MKTIISNTSPVIALSMIEKLPLLWELFDKIYIPNAVLQELTSSIEENDYGRQEILNAIKDKKVSVYSIKDEVLVQQMYGKLHRGELETIIGGKELAITFTLIDEKPARDMARNLFLTPIGTIGVLRLAKSQGAIDKIKPYLDILVDHGYRIGKVLYKQVLKQENEW